jgi:hypothetical protein
MKAERFFQTLFTQGLEQCLAYIVGTQ